MVVASSAELSWSSVVAWNLMKNPLAKSIKRNEKWMAKRVAKHLGNAVHDVPIGGPRLDVVSFNPNKNLFRIVECKWVKDPRRVGQTYGQVLSYYSALRGHAAEFVKSLLKKKRLAGLEGFMETTGGRKARVEFYVGLRDEACKDVNLLRTLKEFMPQIGIVRVKKNGLVRDYIRSEGKKNYRLAAAKPVELNIPKPV